MTRRNWTRTLGLCWLLATTAAGQALAGDPAKPAEGRGKYIRLDRDKAGEPLALETAVVRFSPEDSAQPAVSVDLIGAVHVGEKAYYEDLNKRFEDYDVVLYELVAPPGTRIPKGAKPGSHPVAMLQNGLKDLLGLEHQLQYIDYSKANLVHADMSPDDFSKSMADRNESFVSMFFRMLGQGIAQQSKQQAQGKATSELDLLAALFDSNRAWAMKRVMAEQFENMEGMMEALDGPGGSTIITERNKVALQRLSEQIAAGKKKIAIFYGAGHMPDIEKRLAADFHLRRSSEQWLPAWKLAKDPAEKPKVKKQAA
jgi:hypothetical protein